jgi:phytoene/squalene synthetase
MSVETTLHTDLAELKLEVRHTNNNIERIAQAMEKALGDHEARMRALENYVARIAGALALVSFIGFSAVATLIYVIANK